MKSLIKMAVGVAVLVACFNAGNAALNNYRFEDAVHEGLLYDVKASDGEITDMVMKLADQYDVPLDRQDIHIRDVSQEEVIQQMERSQVLAQAWPGAWWVCVLLALVVAAVAAADGALAAVDQPAFARAQLAGLMEYPRYYAFMAPLNRKGPQVFRTTPSLAKLDLAGFDAAVARGAVVVDARDRVAYAEGHIPGSLNVELNEGFGTYVGWITPFDSEVVLVLGDTDEPEEAVAQLIRVGYDRIAGVLDGGMATWTGAGREARAYPVVTTKELKARLAAYEKKTGNKVKLPVKDETVTIAGKVMNREQLIDAEMRARGAEIDAEAAPPPGDLDRWRRRYLYLLDSTCRDQPGPCRRSQHARSIHRSQSVPAGFRLDRVPARPGRGQHQRDGHPQDRRAGHRSGQPVLRILPPVPGPGPAGRNAGAGPGLGIHRFGGRHRADQRACRRRRQGLPLPRLPRRHPDPRVEGVHGPRWRPRGRALPRP